MIEIQSAPTSFKIPSGLADAAVAVPVPPTKLVFEGLFKPTNVPTISIPPEPLFPLAANKAAFKVVLPMVKPFTGATSVPPPKVMYTAPFIAVIAFKAVVKLANEV